MNPWFLDLVSMEHYKNNMFVDIKICNTNQILISSGHLKARESLYTQLVIWVNTLVENTAKKNRSRFPIAVLLTTMLFSR